MKKYNLLDNVYLRKDAFGWKLVDIEYEYEYRINNTASEILKYVMGGKDIEEIVNILSCQYGLSNESLKDEIDSFFLQLDNLLLTKEARTNKKIVSVDWIITHGCNLRCKHCFVNAPLSTEDELSFENKLKVLEHIFKFTDFVYLTFSGGEPFYCSHFLELLENIPSEKAKVRILTNGTLLLNQVQELYKLRRVIGGIIVSISGVTNKTYQLIRNAMVENVFEGIEACISLDIPIIVVYDTWKGNLNELEEVIKKLINLGVKTANFSVIENKGRADFAMSQSDFLTLDEKVEFHRIVDYLKNKYFDKITIGTSFDIGAPFKKEIHHNCAVFNPNDFSILPNGDIHACYDLSLITNDFHLGNILLDDLPAIIKKKEQMMNKAFEKIKKECRDCEYRVACPGACIVESVRNDHNFYLRNCFKEGSVNVKGRTH